MELSKETMKKIMWLIAYTILLAVLLFNLDVVFDGLKFIIAVLVPFLVGIAVAFVINLPMRFYERTLFPDSLKQKRKIVRKMARPVSLILALLSVIGVLALVIFVVVPEIVRSVGALATTIQNFMPTLEKWIITIFPNNVTIENLISSLDFDWKGILDNVMGFLKNGAGAMLGSTFNFAKVLIGGISDFAIGFVFALYVLLQKEKLRVQLDKIMHAFLPERIVAKIDSVCELTHRTFGSFLTGQCLEAVILTLMFFVVLSVGRFPYALLISVLIGFLSLIPIVGAFIGCIISAFLILMVNPLRALIFIGVFLLIQQIEGNLIYPHVVGGSVGLPSIWVLAAVSLGGSLMGVMGMIVFIPLVSVIYTLFREYVYKRLEAKKIVSAKSVVTNPEED
ncbi:MAG: AI-2E family transporter [Lachnospiraceae bacterium]|nr:AI-2E family transporter [Lachnospiraceae bacterium]MEE1249031.1 AI-2E family transporter [Lachnospiraceae bacterium]